MPLRKKRQGKLKCKTDLPHVVEHHAQNERANDTVETQTVLRWKHVGDDGGWESGVDLNAESIRKAYRSSFQNGDQARPTLLERKRPSGLHCRRVFCQLASASGDTHAITCSFLGKRRGGTRTIVIMHIAYRLIISQLTLVIGTSIAQEIGTLCSTETHRSEPMLRVLRASSWPEERVNM